MEDEIKNTSEKDFQSNDLGFGMKEILISLGYDPENFDSTVLTVEDFYKMLAAGAFGPDGVVISGDHHGPIDAE